MSAKIENAAMLCAAYTVVIGIQRPSVRMLADLSKACTHLSRPSMQNQSSVDLMMAQLHYNVLCN